MTIFVMRNLVNAMGEVDILTAVMGGIVILAYLFLLLVSYVIFRYAAPAQPTWQGRVAYALIMTGALLSVTSLSLLFPSAVGIVDFPKWFRIVAAIGMTVLLAGAIALIYARHRGWAN